MEAAVAPLYDECTSPDKPDDYDETKLPPTSDLGQCKIAALQRLVESPIDFVDGSRDDKECSAVWVPGDKKGEGTIRVTRPPGVNCSQFFPKNRAQRIEMVRQGAYRKDLSEALSGLGSTDGLATVAKLLYALCDTTIGFKDPAECRAQQQKLLSRPVAVSPDGNCPPSIDEKSPLVLVINSGCSAEYLAEADEKTRAQAVQTGIDAYEADKPNTLTDLVHAAYRQCAVREEDGIPFSTNVLPCWEEARKLGSETPYEFVDGKPGTCGASWDNTRTHIVLTGDRATCDTAFPKSGEARGGAVIQGGKEYEQTAALSGATDAASALQKLYDFCNSGKGGDPATCKQEGATLLRDMQISHNGTDCTVRVTTSDGKPTIEVGNNCATTFPESSTDWQAEVNKAVAENPGSADPRTAALTSATDLGSAEAAMYAFCDSGKGGDPVACKKDADALLRDTPILRTGTSCTPEISIAGGKPAIVVGPNCDKQFPDDPALRAAAVDQASKQAQLAEALRGTTDLTAAAKALYAYCDGGAQGDPAVCKKAADALLEGTPIVRAGDKCTADVSSENGKPVIVIGSNCAATAFPDDAKARANAVQEAGPPIVPPNPAQPPNPALPPAPNPAAPPENPVVAPTSTLAPADAPPAVKPAPAGPKVEAPAVPEVDPPPVKKEVDPPPVEKKDEPEKPKDSDGTNQTDTEN